MLQRVLGILRKDWIHTRREKILVYMLAAPIIFALVLRLFLPAVEQAGLTLAVDGSVPAETVARLREFGRVESYDGRDALRERVMRFDDVAGICLQEGQYTVILEGNEADYVRELSGTLVDYVVRGKGPLAVSYRPHSVKTSQSHRLVAAFLVYFCLAIGGITIGFGLVSEREAKTVYALAVSPLSITDYVVGKSIWVLTVSLLLSFACTLMLVGPAAVNYLHLLTAVLCVLGFSLVYGFIIGLAAQTQLGAISVMKSGNTLVLGIPLAAQFLSDKLKWLVYPFPNYWAFEAMRRVFVETGLSRASADALALGLSLALLLLLVPRVKRRLRLG